MNIAKRKERSSALVDSIRDNEEQIIQLISAIEYGERLDDELSRPEVARFIKSWSTSEMSRLAKLRMTLLIDARDDHLTINAQYKAAEKLGQEQETVRATVIENKRILEKARDSLMSKQEQQRKLQE